MANARKLFTAGLAAATLATALCAANPASAQWGGWGGYRPGWGYGGGYRNGGAVAGAAIAGMAMGAIAGAAMQQNRYNSGYGAYGAPGYGAYGGPGYGGYGAPGYGYGPGYPRPRSCVTYESNYHPLWGHQGYQRVQVPC